MIEQFFNPMVETRKRALSSKLQALSDDTPFSSPVSAGADTLPKGEGKGKMNRRLIHGKYTVQDGDTLWDLSWEFFGTPLRWREIAKLNNVRYGHIEPGDELYIPGRIETCPCCGKMI